MNTEDLFYKSSWVWRRTVVFMIVTSGLASLLFMTWRATDAASFALVGGIWQVLILAAVSAFVVGAVVDDSNSMKHGRIDAPAPPQSDTEAQ